MNKELKIGELYYIHAVQSEHQRAEIIYGNEPDHIDYESDRGYPPTNDVVMYLGNLNKENNDTGWDWIKVLWRDKIGFCQIFSVVLIHATTKEKFYALDLVDHW